MSKIKSLLRPETIGFYWMLCPKTGWRIGTAKMIFLDDENEADETLCFTYGGAYARCDMINKNADTGSRFYKAEPPFDLNNNNP